MMSRSSVFLLLLLVVLASCDKDGNWSSADMAGSYSLVPKEKSLMEELLSSDATSGWNFDDPYTPTIVLYADSSFEIQGNGGGFECSSYNGRWWIANDTITLLPWYSYYGTFKEEAAENLEGTWIEVYKIKSAAELEVCESRLLDKGRLLLRR